MNIKLNVKKETFIQYLLKLGYNYKINQYDDFIKRIGSIILNEINTAITEKTLSTKINQIFSTKTDILILEDYLKIENLNESYITSLIEAGLLDLYLEDKTFRINPRIINSLYTYKRIKHLDFDIKLKNSLINSIFNGKLKNNSSLHKSIIKYNKLKLPPISEIEKNNLDKIILDEIIEFSSFRWNPNFSLIHQFDYLTIEDNYEFIKEYIQNNISLDELKGIFYISVVIKNINKDKHPSILHNSTNDEIIFSDILSYDLKIIAGEYEDIIHSNEIKDWKNNQ